MLLSRVCSSCSRGTDDILLLQIFFSCICLHNRPTDGSFEFYLLILVGGCSKAKEKGVTSLFTISFLLSSLNSLVEVNQAIL